MARNWVDTKLGLPLLIFMFVLPSFCISGAVSITLVRISLNKCGGKPGNRVVKENGVRSELIARNTLIVKRTESIIADLGINVNIGGKYGYI